MAQATAEAAVIDASHMIVMPGFVDTHRHIWEGQLRNILPNGLLGDYQRDITGAARAVYRPEDAYAGDLVSALGAMNAGITTLLESPAPSRWRWDTACPPSNRRSITAFGRA